jgi:cation/acetate symporter
VSALVVSVFYLIPQMVGAGALIFPLLGFPHAVGVVAVGAVVIFIVVTAGMVSTTYVQFIKGALLVVFSGLLTVLILHRGLKVDDRPEAMRPQTYLKSADGVIVNGLPQGKGTGQNDLRPVGHLSRLPNGLRETGPLLPWTYFHTLQNSEVVLWSEQKTQTADGVLTTFTPLPVSGLDVLQPGRHPMFLGLRGEALWPKLNFISLMLALFCGTASLPHILIRYYTVKDQASARLSTVVGIAAIGTFYVLTLFLGLGAMTNGTIDLTDSNMAAPLLARSFGELLFAVISAIAFTTVLGTVSGLIVAASGAVVHDLLAGVLGWDLTDHHKVRIGKMAAVVVGGLAVALGIWFKGFNASFLVGWAFSVAASANLPSLVMILFWPGTTRQGVTAAILVGMCSSLAWILLSAEAFQNVYGYSGDAAAKAAWVPFSQPGLVTIPLGFLTLVVVSLFTRSGKASPAVAD